MINTKIICGHELAHGIYDSLKNWNQFIGGHLGRKPSLHVVLVGDNPASVIYVEKKKEQCMALGITSVIHKLPENIAEADLEKLVLELNHDDSVDGILIQMPLPKNLPTRKVINWIDSNKDVDGLTSQNLAALYTGEPGLLPCTPLGVMHILQSIWGDVSGKHVVVMGRSILVGKSLQTMLTNANATVTLMHSYTQNKEAILKLADGVVVATGKPNSLKGEHVKRGTVVIDVGISRNLDGTIVGDVDSKSMEAVAGALTPVPGGVGPMTIAALMANTVRIACYFAAKKKGDFYAELTEFAHNNPFPIGPCI